MAGLESEQTLTYLETAELVNGSLRDIHTDPEFDASIVENQLYPSAYGLLDTLQRYNIEELSVGEFDASNPQLALETVFQSAQLEMDQRGIPHPDLALYQNAMDYAQMTETPMSEVMGNVNAQQPLAMQTELAREDSFNLTLDDVIYAEGRGPLFASAEGASAVPLDVDAQDYREYDVHIVAYPLKTVDLPFTDTDLVMRDMHSFLIVTEPGADPTLPENVVLGMRGGPDNDTAWLSGSGESSLGDYIDDAPPGSRESGDGDLYVQGTQAAIADLDTPHVTVVQTQRMFGNLEEMEANLEGLADIINEADLNYVAVDARWSGMNCNVVSGDGFEMLTGREPVNPYERFGLDERRLPGLEEDALNYEETEYAPLFD